MFVFLTPKVLRGPVYCPEPLTWTFHTRLKGGVCTFVQFVQFCCDTIFQSTKDLAARREVIITDVTAEMWQEPRVPYVSLFASLPRACGAPFKGSAA